MSTKTQVLHKSPGGERVARVLFVVGAAFAKHATNYYTISVRLFHEDEAYGRVVGNAYSLADRNLTANEPVVLYDGPAGTPLRKGDTLVGYLVSTGSPAVLTSPTFIIDRQKITR